MNKKRKTIKTKITLSQNLIRIEEDKENYYLVIERPLSKLLGKTFILDLGNQTRK
jgi:hypothetical protein